MSDQPETRMEAVRRVSGSPAGEQPKGSSTEESSASKPAAETQQSDPNAVASRQEAEKPESGGEQRVPIERLQQVLAQNTEAKAALASRDKELATLREQVAEHESQRELADIVGGKRPKGWGDLDEEAKMVWLARETAQRSQTKEPKSQEPNAALAGMVAKLELMETEGFSLQQAGAIVNIQEHANGLSMEETVMLARTRSPDLFSEEGTSGSVSSVPATHAVAGPSSSKSSQPPNKDTVEEARQEMLGAKSYGEAKRKAVNFIAEMRKQSPLTRKYHGSNV